MELNGTFLAAVEKSSQILVVIKKKEGLSLRSLSSLVKCFRVRGGSNPTTFDCSTLG